MARKDPRNSDRLFDRIVADGWAKYLKTVSRSGARAFYAYLARKKEKKRGFRANRINTVAQHGPIIPGDGENCREVAWYFDSKLKAKAASRPQDAIRDPDEQPLPPSRRKGEWEHTPAVEVKVFEAIRSLSTGKAPGPDGFPSEMCKRLPVLEPVSLGLANLVCQTGLALMALHWISLAPLVKPGRDPHAFESRRPILPQGSVLKIAESITHHSGV